MESSHKGGILQDLSYILVWAVCVLPFSLAPALSLTERSPFLPDGFTAPAGQSQQAATRSIQGLEFKGMYQLNNTYYFLVSERNKAGQWISMGNPKDDISVEEFDSSGNKLRVAFAGKDMWLELTEMATLTGQVAQATRGNTQSTARKAAAAAAAKRTNSTATRRRTVQRPTASNGSTTSSSSIARKLPTRRTPSRPSSRFSRRTAPAEVPTSGLPAGNVPTAPPTAAPGTMPGAPPSQDPSSSPFN